MPFSSGDFLLFIYLKVLFLIDFGWGNLIILVDFILFLFSPESLRGRLLMKKERKKSRPVVCPLKWDMDLPCDRDPAPILISTRWLRP